MPRTYKSKVDRDREGRKENLTAAIKLVQSNYKELTTAQASRRFGCPIGQRSVYTTLRDHVKGISQKIGAGCPTVLTRAEKQEIVVTCQLSNISITP